MIRNNLPKGWIVLNSKTRPGRVYYYNVKTSESSWKMPTTNEDTQEQAKERKVQNAEAKKRKRLSQSSEDEVQSVIYENAIPESDISTRRKLVAKTSVKKTEEKVTDEKETPQMKAIRQLMLKRKEKASRQTSTKSSKDVKTLRQKSDKGSSPKVNVAANSSPEVVNTSQMEALLEKMVGRATKSNSKTKLVQEKDSTIPKGRDLRSRLRKQNSCDKTDVSDVPPSTKSDITREVQNNPKDGQVATRASLLRECDSVDSKVPTVKQNRGSFKKNLGKERMEKLRKSLEKLDDDISSVTATTTHSTSSYKKKLSFPITSYKHAEVRLTRLREETIKSKLSKKERTCVNKQDESINSFKGTITVTDNEKPVTLEGNSLRQSNADSSYEEMDWEPMEVDEITNEVQAIRTQLCTENNVKTSCNIASNTLKYPLLPEQQEKKHLYIVVDTNVFLSNIEAIELARETTFDIYDKPVIVIPWTVIRELDYIKDDGGKSKSALLCANARKAIRYINKLFTSKQSRIMSQRPEDVGRNKKKFSTNCPDDEILQTCLQVRDLGKFVVLLSYDINLCNKAMIYDIVTLGKNDRLEKIALTTSTSEDMSASKNADEKKLMNSKAIAEFELSLADDIYEDAKSIIRDFLTVIVSKELNSLYGDSWEKYVLIKPPWTTITVLQCAIKHWIAIVSESFTKKADVIMKELLQTFKDTSGRETLEESGHTLDKCNTLIQMIDISKHSDLMLRASRKIEELKKKWDDCVDQVNEKKLQSIIGVEDDVEEQQNRAQRAFQFFEAAYVYARDICGLASKAMGIVCNFHYNIPNPTPSLDYIEQIQPRLAMNVNKLATNLIAIMEQAKQSCIEKKTLFELHDALINFLPENEAVKFFDINLTPLDVYYCIKHKEEVLLRGLRQLQELDSQYFNLANHRYA